ncbi:hypothetical protein ACINWC743_A0669 [Acinetobacter sp. WC-743]|nr:hypothetical protein ACINWC743_A0669 [Acinetobacter sp. WC-743]
MPQYEQKINKAYINTSFLLYYEPQNLDQILCVFINEI